MALLKVSDLRVNFDTADGEVSAVNGLSFELDKGETLGIVGESGSGKSQAMLSLIGLLAANGRASGQAQFQGTDLLSMNTAQINKVRGKAISMVFQDPMTSLNPYLTIATQMSEVLMLHEGLGRSEADRRALEMLDAVKIPDAKRRFKMYPHEFSGGMRQRVMIAMALLCKPDLLIADEPTTALDVTVQAQIIDLMKDLRETLDTAIIMITHDLGVVAGLCDRIMVMYAGEVVESGPLRDVFYHPLHPYTQGLLRAVPRLDEAGQSELATIPGNPPNLMHLPSGCPFRDRCEYAKERCMSDHPELRMMAEGHWKACHMDDAA